MRAKSLDVGVDLIALIFSRTLNIHSITVVEPEVALVHTDGGKWNFSTLGAAQGTAAKSPAGAASFSVQKLRVVHGRVSVATVGKKPLTYEDVTLDAGNISYTSPIPFTVEATTPGRRQAEGGGQRRAAWTAPTPRARRCRPRSPSPAWTWPRPASCLPIPGSRA